VFVVTFFVGAIIKSIPFRLDGTFNYYSFVSPYFVSSLVSIIQVRDVKNFSLQVLRLLIRVVLIISVTRECRPFRDMLLPCCCR
jgi:hypothetical protein